MDSYFKRAKIGRSVEVSEQRSNVRPWTRGSNQDSRNSDVGQFSNQYQCNQDGCGFNAYRYGAKTFWGQTVDSKQKITVVTQFLTAGGKLSEIRRFYIQNGKAIPNPKVSVYGNGNFDSVNEAFCKAAGHQVDGWRGLGQMGASFERGHVLVFSLWDSNSMQWLDGGGYGPCVESNKAAAEAIPGVSVTWSNLKFGDLDSTY
jgi:cellulose 1,4-beta-cellobiosidase